MNRDDPRSTGIRSDSGPSAVTLSDMGFEPGRQLVAFVLVSSDCSYCKQPDTKLGIAALRDRFRTNTSNGYRSATVVGVDLDLNLEVGLNYLRGIGLDQFDEISVGKSWLNENLVRLVWRDKAAPPSVPQVIIVSRDMNAKLKPLRVDFTTDSVLSVLTGRKAILSWVRAGAQVPKLAHDELVATR